MESYQQILKILHKISIVEDQLENYRQLLNQQITFNLPDLIIAINRNSIVTNAFIISNFLSTSNQTPRDHQTSLSSLESVIRFYNQNTSLNLTFVEFSSLFLSRQNKLLAKMVLERPEMGAIPGYLLSYARKIIRLQSDLHEEIIEFRKSHGHQIQNWLKGVEEDTYRTFVDEEKLTRFCLGQDEINCSAVIRYLKGISGQKIELESLRTLLTLKNCSIIADFLKEKQNQISSKTFKNQSNNPFIRHQFNDCLQRPKMIEKFSYRQVRSIEKHLQRVNVKNKEDLTQKIQKYRNYVQKQVRKVCKTIMQIVSIERDIELARIQLCLCSDFYPIIFYNSFDLDKNSKLIPSSFSNYFQNLSVNLPLKKIFLLFKRFSSHEDGKMSFNSFCRIFDICNSNLIYNRIQKNRKVVCLQDISVDTKMLFVNLLNLTIENEYKCQKIKHSLMKSGSVELRDVFSCIDMDDNGVIDQLDIKIAWRKFMNLELSSQQVDLFWYRVKGRNTQNRAVKLRNQNKQQEEIEIQNKGKDRHTRKSCIHYQEFIQEMTPKLAFKN